MTSKQKGVGIGDRSMLNAALVYVNIRPELTQMAVSCKPVGHTWYRQLAESPGVMQWVTPPVPTEIRIWTSAHLDHLKYEDVEQFSTHHCFPLPWECCHASTKTNRFYTHSSRLPWQYWHDSISTHCVHCKWSAGSGQCHATWLGCVILPSFR